MRSEEQFRYQAFSGTCSAFNFIEDMFSVRPLAAIPKVENSASRVALVDQSPATDTCSYRAPNLSKSFEILIQILPIDGDFAGCQSSSSSKERVIYVW